MDSTFQYAGSELDLFALVHNWKTYWSEQVRPFLSGDVLEAGAGIGSNTQYLDAHYADTAAAGKSAQRWVCMEPDPQLVAQLEKHLAGKGRGYEIICGTIQSLPSAWRFDTVVYIDVLEHIEKDREELEAAGSRLKAGGRVVVLSPAHQSLFTPFDAAIGHYRRYNRGMLRKLSPRGLRLVKLKYLDSVGLSASIANRLFLRQSMPTKEQLAVWDRWMIPVSRWIDPAIGYTLGKTIVGVWEKA
jgi:2-polyprenyl-3-methyl-5-hydroxy-6-metoxy-1,4-benzoquinol methylase